MTTEAGGSGAASRLPLPSVRWVWLPPALALTTGMVDVIGWLSLDHFYTANITGDLTQTVGYLVPGRQAHLLQILAAPVFLVGLVASYFTIRRLGAENQGTVRLLFAVQSVLLLGAAAVAGAFGLLPWSPEARQLVLGLLAVLTISLSNATMTILDHGAPTTWALTANTVRAGVALLNVATRTGSDDQRADDWRTWTEIWPTVLAFLIGGVVAVAAIDHLGARVWLIPLAASLIYAALLWRGTPGHHPTKDGRSKEQTPTAEQKKGGA